MHSSRSREKWLWKTDTESDLKSKKWGGGLEKKKKAQNIAW